MAIWINIYGCQPSKCKSAQKPKLLVGTVTICTYSVFCQRKQPMCDVIIQLVLTTDRYNRELFSLCHHLLARKVDFFGNKPQSDSDFSTGVCFQKNDFPALKVMAKAKRALEISTIGYAFNSLCGYEFKNISTLRSFLLYPLFGPQSSLY